MDASKRNEFELAAAQFRRAGTLRDFLGFLNQTKKWWLLPIVLVLLLLGTVLFLSSSVIAPFLYPLF
jgi:hypothetical protein